MVSVYVAINRAPSVELATISRAAFRPAFTRMVSVYVAPSVEFVIRAAFRPAFTRVVEALTTEEFVIRDSYEESFVSTRRSAGLRPADF